MKPWNRAPTAAAPYFPPPPAAPTRDRGRERSRANSRPNPVPLANTTRAPPARLSCDSDASSGSASHDAGSPPPPRGLRPPPIHSRSLTPRQAKSEEDNEGQEDGISPLLSRAPALPVPVPVPAPPASPTPTLTPTSATDDKIPDQHKRIPGRIARSPASPSLGLGLGQRLASLRFKPSSPSPTSPTPSSPSSSSSPSPPLSPLRYFAPKPRLLTGNSQKRKPAPPPIVVADYARAHRADQDGDDCQSRPVKRGLVGVEEVVVVVPAGSAGGAESVKGSIVSGANSPGSGSGPVFGFGVGSGIGTAGLGRQDSLAAAPALGGGSSTNKKGKGGGSGKRRTVWGFIEGWWDLGLLERMGTVRRKR